MKCQLPATDAGGLRICGGFVAHVRRLRHQSVWQCAYFGSSRISRTRSAQCRHCCQHFFIADAQQSRSPKTVIRRFQQ